MDITDTNNLIWEDGMSNQEDNRWARPVMDDVSWDHATGIPAFLNERSIREGLAKHVGLPAMIIVAGDPHVAPR